MFLRSLGFRLIALGLLLGAVAVVSSDAFAQMSVSREPWSSAVSGAVYYKVAYPTAGLFLLAPFACIGCAAAAFSRNGRAMRGYCILACGILLLSVLCVWGYLGVQRARQEHAWTAAALSEGLLPCLGVPVVVVSILLGLLASSLASALAKSTGRGPQQEREDKGTKM
jgi:protein-S-isoprenylcysteine O-methyltransferase Ste14